MPSAGLFLWQRMRVVPMKFVRRLIILFAGLLVLSAGAHAADSGGAYAIDGGGGASCKAFTESRKAGSNRANDLFAGWVDGYVSAANQNRADTFDLTPWQTTELLLVLLGRYCESYPDDRFEIAVNNMLTALNPQRLTARSDKLLVGGEGQGISIYRDVLKRAQASLAKHGFYSGPLDGNYTDETRKAFTAYQEKNALKPSGLPEAETLYRLLPLDAGAPVNGKKP